MEHIARQRTGSVLSKLDPDASRTLNPDATLPVLLVCDHASNAVPSRLNQLGLDTATLNRHVGLDIGSGPLTERLSEQLGYTAVLCNYSRLVIDCNRSKGDPTLIPQVSDDVLIPGNQALSDAAQQARYNEIYTPYHAQIETQLSRLEQHTPAPVLVAIHSFTPQLNKGETRPWHAGILWDKDERIAGPLLRELRADKALCVGDNEPYSGKHPADYTIDHHGEDRGIPCVSIEIRQDLLSTSQDVDLWAQRLGRFFRQMETKSTEFTKRM